MSKVNKKKIYNKISHNNGSTHTSEPSFAYNEITKELYESIINSINKLTNPINHTYTKETLINLLESLMDKNELLNEEYKNKFNELTSENTELYNEFETTIKNQEENYRIDLFKFDLELEEQLNQINDNLYKFQQDAIARYKAEENIFIPKTKFLTSNKKINKDEYIKVITEINHNRILANQKYLSIANDLSSVNEQQQLKFKHSIESAVEKNINDKKNFTEQSENEIESLKKISDENETAKKQQINNSERNIIQNTVEVNDLITRLGEDYANRLKYAYIPYEIKSNKLIDELDENNKTYNTIEEKVLDEFKTLLQQNDNEIEELRLKHKDFEEKYLEDLKAIKKFYNSKYQKDINIINKNIAIATKKYTSSLKKEDKAIVKRLVSEKKAYIKNLNNEKNQQIKKIKDEYYKRELSYIERFERLRTKKSQSEAVKSSAMKNINYERVFHHERINSEIKLVTYEKECYTNTDHYEEIKDIYNNRLKCSIENELLHFNINEKELEYYTSEVNIKYQQEKIIALKDYNLKLCDADLVYQEESTKNRINFYNVKTMLSIQREGIINDFEVLFTNEKMNFEQIKNFFYNNCDNIQYEIYKSSNESISKTIDTEVNQEQELSELERQFQKTVTTHRKSVLNNEKVNEENSLQVQLYEKRLEVEKVMIFDTYNLYVNQMQNVFDFENYLNSYIEAQYKEEFEENKKEFLVIFNYLRKLKLCLTDQYHDQETNIIKEKANFESSIKFKKQIDNTKRDYFEFTNHFKNRKNKTIQTLNSYQETLTLFLSALKNTKEDIFKKRIILLTKFLKKKDYENIKKEIKQDKINLLLLKKQIDANKHNISKMKKLSLKQEKERSLRERHYNTRFLKIEKQRKNEEKVYNNSLLLINQQYVQLKNKIDCIKQYVSNSKFQFKKTRIISSYINYLNNLVIELSKKHFDTHSLKIAESLTTHYSIQKDIYHTNFLRSYKEIQKSYIIEFKEYKTNKQAIKSSYKSKFETLKKQHLYTKNKLLIELKKLNIKHLINLEKFNQTMEKINSKKEFELACHDENYQMYITKFEENNNEIINKYLAKIKEIKLSYGQILTEIENKYNKIKKKINIQHNNNLLLKKNNITNLENEHKENIKKTMIKIKKINQDEKQNHQKYEESKKISYKLYYQNQHNTRKEFTLQLKNIEEKCNKRIKLLQKEFKKKFKKEKN